VRAEAFGHVAFSVQQGVGGAHQVGVIGRTVDIGHVGGVGTFGVAGAHQQVAELAPRGAHGGIAFDGLAKRFDGGGMIAAGCEAQSEVILGSRLPRLWRGFGMGGEIEWACGA